MQEEKIDEILKILKELKKKNVSFNNEKEKILYINKMLSGKGSVSVRINQAAYDEAKKLCDVTGVSINSYVSTAVALRTYEDKK